MKVQSIYLALFLTTASAYIAETPGSKESPLKLEDQKQAKVAHSPHDIKTVASQGMLGGTDDLMKRLSLGSDFAAASYSDESEVAAVIDEAEIARMMAETELLIQAIKKLDDDEKKEVIDKEEQESPQEQIKPTAMIEETEILIKAIKELDEKVEIFSKKESDSPQEQIKPTKVKTATEVVEEAPKSKAAENGGEKTVKLTIVEDVDEEETMPELEVEWDEAEEETVPEPEAIAVVGKESIISGRDEAEDDEETVGVPTMEEEDVITLTATEEVEEAALAMVQAPEPIQEIVEEPLPYSPYSREQMVVFSAVDDFSAKFDEKLPRRLVSSYRLDQNGRRVNTMHPAFAARTQHPNRPQPVNHESPPSATGTEHVNIGDGAMGKVVEGAAGALQRSPRPGRRIGYLPHEYTCESWFDTKSKVTSAVYGGKSKDETKKEEAPRVPVSSGSFQPASSWFDTRSKVTEAIYGTQPEIETSGASESYHYYPTHSSQDKWHD
ncbi:MAG: hypothetical protein SGBAC_013492 [Bacillariaceae sp.]